MAKQPIEERIINCISDQLGIAIHDTTPDKNLRDDLGADSLDDVEIIMALEEEFGIEIPDAEAEKCKTVQDIITTVKEHLDDEEG